MVLLERESPGGRVVPSQVNGPTPPLTVTGELYATLSVPAGKLGFAITGGGSRETENVADLVGSVTDVAVNEAMLEEVIVTGALYVTVVDVGPLIAPAPVNVDHVTPALPGSLFTVAVINCVVL